MKDNCVICCAIVDEPPEGTTLCSIECKLEFNARILQTIRNAANRVNPMREAVYREADFI